MSSGLDEVKSVAMASVSESRLKELEHSAELVSMIRDARYEAMRAAQRVSQAKTALKDLQKRQEDLEAYVRQLEIEGVPQPEAQANLPFVDEDEDLGEEDDGGMTAEIESLPIPAAQKKVLIEERIRSIRDIIELEAGNMELLEKGLGSIIGLSASSAKAIREVLPETAPEIPLEKGEPEASRKLIRVLNASGGEDVKFGYRYWASVRANGRAAVVMGGKWHWFDEEEYELVE